MQSYISRADRAPAAGLSARQSAVKGWMLCDRNVAVCAGLCLGPGVGLLLQCGRPAPAARGVGHLAALPVRPVSAQVEGTGSGPAVILALAAGAVPILRA